MSRTYGKAQDLIDFTRASSATYLDSDGLLKTASNNIPRIEYDAQGNVLGLLVEESRTNLITSSEDFTTGAWSASGSSAITSNYGLSLDGQQNATLLSGATTGYTGSNRLARVTNISSSTAYTFSVWIKLLTATTASIDMFDGSTGAYSKTNTSATTDWQRISVTRTSGASTSQFGCSIGLADGDILIYGAQLEAGSFPTSLIPTSGSTATRSADVASLSTSAFGYRQDEGTVVVDWSSSHIPWNSYNRVFEIGENGVNSNISLLGTQGSAQTYVTINNNGSEQLSYSSNFFVVSQSTFYKTAIGIKKDDVNLAYNSILRTTDTSVNVPYMGAGAKLYIGGDRYGGARFTGYIKSLKYIPRRLTNDQLVEVTS